MSSEIQVSMSLRVEKGYLQHTQNPGSQVFDMTGTRAAGGAIAASTTAVALDINPLSATTVGWTYFRNTSVTAGESVIVGTGTGGSFVPFTELRPKEVALLRINSSGSGTTPTFKSLAGTPVLQYWIAEA